MNSTTDELLYSSVIEASIRTNKLESLLGARRRPRLGTLDGDARTGGEAHGHYFELHGRRTRPE